MKANSPKIDEWQRIVNERLWQRLNRLSNGNLAELGRVTGLSSQTFYNIRENRSFPSVPTLLILKDIYPQVDWDAVTSIGEVATVVSRDEVSEWRSKYERAAEQNMRLMDKVLDYEAMSFLMTSSQATLSTQVEGFRRYERAISCGVRQLKPVQPYPVRFGR